MSIVSAFSSSTLPLMMILSDDPVVDGICKGGIADSVVPEVERKPTRLRPSGQGSLRRARRLKKDLEGRGAHGQDGDSPHLNGSEARGIGEIPPKQVPRVHHPRHIRSRLPGLYPL